MAKRKFYAVVSGRRPGIYTDWFGEQGAEAQVKGLTSAIFKGFATLEDAEAWYRERANTAPVRRFSAEQMPPPPPPLAVPVETALADGKIVLFTDGGADGNPGPGGYGVVLRHGDKRKELSGGFARTTNNRMELMAAIVGLRVLKGRRAVVLYSDSAYMVDGMTKGWARRWRERGWMLSANQPAKNADLWQELLTLSEQHDVTFVKVPGHAGVPENEWCDRLAVAASHQRGLPPDPGFDG